MSDLLFTVHGPPVPYARPRLDTSPMQEGKRPRFFTDPRSRNYRRAVHAEAWAAARRGPDGLSRRDPPWPTEDGCGRRKHRRGKGRRPKCACAWCTTEYRLTLYIVMPDRRRTDVDNLEKNILDACTGALYQDDRQAYVERKTRVFNKERPRIEVSVRIATKQEELDLDATEQQTIDFPSEGWETPRALEWIRRWYGAATKATERPVGDLAALLRDCWASGFLEGMDADPGAEPKGPPARLKGGLRLVHPPKENR